MMLVRVMESVSLSSVTVGHCVGGTLVQGWSSCFPLGVYYAMFADGQM